MELYLLPCAGMMLHSSAAEDGETDGKGAGWLDRYIG